MIKYWFSANQNDWIRLRNNINLEIESDDSFEINKSISRKQQKKRRNFESRQKTKKKIKERIILSHDVDEISDAVVLEAIIWGDQYLRHTLSQTYGNKRKNSPETRSRVVKQRQGFQVPIPEWSWTDVYGSRAVHERQVEHRDQRRIVL